MAGPVDSDEADRAVLNAALMRIATLEWRTAPGAARPGAEATLHLGRFEGLPPQIALLDDGRRVRLLAPLSFVQGDGTSWPVPRGIEVDGASIPRLLWSLVGGPFEGRYRDASIVHDHYCVVRTRSWQATHRMFYEAVRSSGESDVKAKIMFYAVWRFGPRWGTGAAATDLEALAGLDGVRSFAADAEAIYVHNLDLPEIEALAEARDVAATTDAVITEGVENLQRVRLLVVPGGSGTSDDVEAVVGEALLLPDYVLRRFERKSIRIVACRGGVPDFERSLRGVTPRGWPAGSTWDTVPGAYFQDKKRVVIATIDDGGGRRMVPTPASRLHGSASLTVHESLHGFDYSGGHAVLRDQAFLAARNADMHRLGPYEKQAGNPGLEETFAESGARFVAEPGMQGDWTNLFNYWQGQSFVEGAQPAEVVMEQAEGDAIGLATVEADGTIVLDLRAEGEGGAIGHGVVTIAPNDPRHVDLRSHVAPGSSTEAFTASPLLFRPIAAGGRMAAARRNSSRGRDIMSNPRKFIETAELAQPSALEMTEGPDVPPLNLDKLPPGIVSSTTLIDFSAVPDPEVRAGISLSMLFASRVATQATKDVGDQDAWLASYTSALNSLGFAVSGMAMMNSTFSKTGLEVHKAIIPFLTVAFGGAAVGPIIIAALQNLQSMAADTPWIQLFDRETRRFEVRELHFAAANSTATETSIRYAVARLNVSASVTSVLFFKLSQAEAAFQSATTTMTANNSLMAIMEPDLRARLGMMAKKFILSADIGN